MRLSLVRDREARNEEGSGTREAECVAVLRYAVVTVEKRVLG